MIETISPKDEMRHIANKEIREEFIKSFEEAQNSLCIASPWLNNYVVNEDLIRKMENALKRGVSIRIRYGIEDNSYNSQSNNRSLNSERIATNLINRFEKYGQRFKMQKVNSHYKVMICDESYYIEGSYNFLSFAGEYDDRTKDHRDEGGFDVDKSRKIGAAVGSGAVGLLTGEIIGGTITTVTALTGTASIGAAISSLHGVAASNATMATIGGGALSVGGAGITGGHAILTAIDVASTVSASASGIGSELKSNTEKQLSGEVINVSEDDYTVSSDD